MNSKATLTRTLAILGIVSLLFLAGCGGGTGQSLNNQPAAPIPTITTISPIGAMAGGPAFTLTVNGTNFVPASAVNFGGTARPTTFVTSTQLTAAIPAAAIASSGTVGVTVTNAGAQTSNALNFTVTSGINPVPKITNVSPSEITVGGPSFTLTVFGSNFVSDSVVRWNGGDQATAFVNSGQVTAQIAAANISAIGAVVVTVFNPAPVGGISNSTNLNIVTTALGPLSVAIAPDPTGKFGKFAYVANSGSNNVSMYTIGAMSGALTLIGTIPAGTGPASVGIDPSGKFVYVANGGFGPDTASVSMYAINGTTGALTPAGAISESCPTELCTASSLTVHPSGKFAYVGDGYPGENVSMFAIDPNTGALTFLGTIEAASPDGSNSMEVAMHPSGKFAYAVGDNCALDTFDGYVSTYSINLTSGALSSAGSPVAAGVCPSSVAVDPLGRFVYVTDNSGLNGHQDDNVAMYAINGTTGALTFIGYAGTGLGPSFVAVDPTGKFAYVTNFLSNDVSMYTINGTTGALASIGTIAAGTGPVSVAVDPTGKFAYVANSGSNNVSMYSIDAATGALTLIGTIGA